MTDTVLHGNAFGSLIQIDLDLQASLQPLKNKNSILEILEQGISTMPFAVTLRVEKRHPTRTIGTLVLVSMPLNCWLLKVDLHDLGMITGQSTTKMMTGLFSWMRLLNDKGVSGCLPTDPPICHLFSGISSVSTHGKNRSARKKISDSFYFEHGPGFTQSECFHSHVLCWAI